MLVNAAMETPEEASVSSLLRSTWRFTQGRRLSMALAAALSLALFALSAILPLLIGRLLDTALERANADEKAQQFVDEWLSIQDTTRRILSRDGGLTSVADSVALGVRSAAAQAVASRADEHLNVLFPGDLRYDVAGLLGSRLRSGFDNSDATWVTLVRTKLADPTLSRDDVRSLLPPAGGSAAQDNADAFSYLVATLSLEPGAASQRDEWRRVTFLRDLVLVGSVVGLVALLRLATLRRALRVTLDGARRMQDEVFRRVHDTALVESGALGRPSMVSRCTTYIERVESAMTQLLTKGLPAGANVLFSAIILIAIDVQIGVLMCLLLVVFEVLRRFVSPRWSKSVRVKLDDNTRLSEVADDAITNIASVRAAGAEAVQRRLFADRAEAVRRQAVRIETFSEGFDFAAFAVAQLGLLASVAVIGFTRGATTLGAAAASILYVKAMSDAIGALPGVLISLQEAAPYMRRLDRVLGFPLRREPGNPMAEPEDDVSPVLQLRGASYKPHDGSLGCHRVDLALRSSSTHFVVAQKRSVRMSVLLLASGLELPAEGEVSVGGRSTAELDLVELRRSVAFVVSDPYVADTTVAENLRLLNPEATDERVLAAVASAGLDAWLASQRNGLDTPIGRTGHRLTRTDRVRLGLARAIVCDAPAIVVDDPTLELDREAADDLWAIIRSLSADRAVLIATSQLGVIEGRDTLSVLIDGTVVETGTADELLKRGRHWAGMWSRHKGNGDLVATLQAIPALSTTAEAVLQRAARRVVTESYTDGERIFEVGEPSDRLFLLVRGSVELWEGDRRVASLHDGDHFGEFDPHLEQASDTSRPVSAVARGAVTLQSLHRQAFNSGPAQVLDGSAEERRLYRALARNGRLDLEALRKLLPDVDLESSLEQMERAGAIVRGLTDGRPTWRIAGSSSRTRSQVSVLDSLVSGTPADGVVR